MLIKLTSECGQFWLFPVVKEQFKHEIPFLYLLSDSYLPQKKRNLLSKMLTKDLKNTYLSNP